MKSKILTNIAIVTCDCCGTTVYTPSANNDKLYHTIFDQDICIACAAKLFVDNFTKLNLTQQDIKNKYLMSYNDTSLEFTKFI